MHKAKGSNSCERPAGGLSALMGLPQRQERALLRAALFRCFRLRGGCYLSRAAPAGEAKPPVCALGPMFLPLGETGVLATLRVGSAMLAPVMCARNTKNNLSLKLLLTFDRLPVTTSATTVIGESAVVVAYARTSTVEQVAGLEAQERDLRAAGVERVFAEQISSVATRSQLEAVLDFIREGDVFVVTKIDRLARSVADLCAIVKRIEAKGATLRVLQINLDTSTPTGKLMLNMLGSIAEFERSLMLERQREGIAKAKGEGKYKGRAPTARAKGDDVRRLAAEGMTREAIASQLNIGVASVYRALRAA